MFRSFPRKRESRAKYAGPSAGLWVPAFAGTSGLMALPYAFSATGANVSAVPFMQ